MFFAPCPAPLQLADSDIMKVLLQRIQRQPQHITRLLLLLRKHLCCKQQLPGTARDPRSRSRGDSSGSASVLLTSRLPAAVLDGFSDSSDSGSDSDDDAAGGDHYSTVAFQNMAGAALQRARAQAAAALVWPVFDVLYAADREAVLGLLQNSRVLQQTAMQTKYVNKSSCVKFTPLANITMSRTLTMKYTGLR